MNVTIISAGIDSGKTTYAKKIISENESKYIGFLSNSNQEKSTYFLYDIKSKEEFALMDECVNPNSERIGKFYIYPNVFDNARKKLLNQLKECSGDIVVVLDEVGRLELRGSGFNKLLNDLIQMNIDLILCVRDSFVSDVINFYSLNRFDIKIIRIM